MGAKWTKKEDIEAMFELIKEEIEFFDEGQLGHISTNDDLALLIGISKKSLPRLLTKLEPSLRKKRAKLIQSQTAREVYEQTIGSFSPTEKLKIYKRSLGQLSPEERRENLRNWRNERSAEELSKISRTAALANYKINGSPFERMDLEKRRELFDMMRKQAYDIENRFYASSQQEGAVALLLEKYIPDYKTNEGETFQVRNNGINNGGLDFLVGDEFLEWHPIILAYKKRGDISSEEEYLSYKKVIANMTAEDKKEFDNEYKRVLAINYRNARQGAVDSSEYAGANVSLAMNPRELYDFLLEHGAELPSYSMFDKEFKKAVKYVKGFKVQKKEKDKFGEVA